jgi:hypothetical protein
LPFNSNCSQAPFLSGANLVPLGKKGFSAQSRTDPRANLFSGSKGRTSCSRCLSNAHSRPNCNSSTRCNSFFRLGHIAISCRFPPRFPGLPKDRIFSCHLRSDTWDPTSVATWFTQSRSLNGGASEVNPPIFTPASSSSIPWTLPALSFLAISARPSSPATATRHPSGSVLPELQLCTPRPKSQPPPPPPPPPEVESPSSSF